MRTARNAFGRADGVAAGDLRIARSTVAGLEPERLCGSFPEVTNLQN